MVRKIALLAVLALFAALLSIPIAAVGNAQQGPDDLPSRTEQQQAAEQLMTQIQRTDGFLDPATITIDPALGPPPWTSYVPDRDEATIKAWNALASRIGMDQAQQARANGFGLPNAGPNANLVVEDSEGVNETGQNDSIDTGQYLTGVGTGPGETSTVRIVGTLGSPPPPPPEPQCPSTEEDGSIPDANATDIELGLNLLCGGEIGDGAFGDTSGDVDFFALNFAPAGSILTVDAGSFDPNAVFALTTAIYTADGTLLGSLNDTDSFPSSILSVVAPADGEYFAAIAGIDALPADPFDPSSGTGVSYVGDYLFFGSVVPGPPEPCIASEPDSTIPDANVRGVDGPISCFGLIGDGEFGTTTGDFDYFVIEAQPESDIIVDVVSPPNAGETPTTIGLYTADGELLASADDNGIDGNLIIYSASDPGPYYALVSSPGVLPSDPFDPSSGTIAGPETGYEVFAFAIPRLGPPPVDPVPDPGPDPVPTATPVPLFAANDAASAARTMIETALAQWAAEVAELVPPSFNAMAAPCASTEDDGAIPFAVATQVDFGESVECLGEIGDGPFGDSSGDIDFYSVFVDAGEALVADTDAQNLGDLDTVITVFDEFGNVIAQNDQFDGNDSRVETPVPAAGTYFVSVYGWPSAQNDPFDSASGTGAGTTGPYALTLSRVAYTPPDVDVYLVDLDVGDAIGTGFTMTGTTTIVDPTGRLGMQSGGTASIIYPLTSPLRHLGNVGADFVAEVSGTHAVIFADGPGRYEGELQVIRSGLKDAPGDDAQTIFLDFDGGSFNAAIFDPFAPNDSGPIRTLSPLRDFLPRWGLTDADESAVITAIVREFEENLLHDLHEVGGNGNRDATGSGGELDVQVLNSRDHDDPWGQPNVSRIIIGGTIPEAGIPTVGIAQSIDPGNFATEETGIVLLDLLSDPAGIGSPSLNDFGVAPPFTKIHLVGRGVGVITAHEAGHFIGNWHTASFNGQESVMDEGGDIITTVGVGDDLVFGTADDLDPDFVTDEFSFFEGFAGFENTTVRSAQAFSTGQTDVPVVGPELPDDGEYYLQNVGNARFLDADPNGDVNTSLVPTSDNAWELINIGDDIYNLRNVDFDTYLDADNNGTVDQSQNPRSDDRWQLIPAGGDTFFLFSLDRGRYLSGNGAEAELSSQQTDAQRWTFEPIVVQPPGGYIGQTIALQSNQTGRWLDGISVIDNGVGQTQVQSADTQWLVTDAGNGEVFLINEVSGEYLDADGGTSNIRSSDSNDDGARWMIVELASGIALENVEYEGFLFAQGAGADFNVVKRVRQSARTAWNVVVIDNPL